MLLAAPKYGNDDDYVDDIHDDLVDLDDSLDNGQIDPTIYNKLKESLEAKLDQISGLIDSKIKNEIIMDPTKFEEMPDIKEANIDPGYIDPSPIEDHAAEINEVKIVYDGVEGHPSQHYEVVNSIGDMDEHDAMSSPTAAGIQEQAAFDAKIMFN